MPPKLGARGLWKPLRLPVFRELLVADVVSDIGTFMQSVGAAWLMVSMHASPFYVALTQTASTAPFFLLALPAGALGDIVDRRKLILYTEAWMLAVAVILAVTTLAGAISPWLLLALTFALSAGDAMESPTWRAVLPELVGKDDLPAASALNGIEFNIARAVGPALAGLLIAAAGVGAAFLVNVFSFFGVILVIARWKRTVRPRTAPTEALTGATIAAIRYVRHVPAMRAIMLRSAAAMFCASASFALLPVIANRAGSSSITYGLLLGAFGVGAVVGAVDGVLAGFLIGAVAGRLDGVLAGFLVGIVVAVTNALCVLAMANLRDSPDVGLPCASACPGRSLAPCRCPPARRSPPGRRGLPVAAHRPAAPTRQPGRSQGALALVCSCSRRFNCTHRGG